MDLKTDYIGKPIEGSRNIRLIIILHITKPSLIIHMKCYSKYYIALIQIWFKRKGLGLLKYYKILTMTSQYIYWHIWNHILLFVFKLFALARNSTFSTDVSFIHIKSIYHGRLHNISYMLHKPASTYFESIYRLFWNDL